MKATFGVRLKCKDSPIQCNISATLSDGYVLTKTNECTYYGLGLLDLLHAVDWYRRGNNPISGADCTR